MPFQQQQTAAPDVNVSVSANDLASQIRAQVNAQLKQAGVEQSKAQSAADRAAQQATQGAGKSDQVTVITKDGKTITIHTPLVGPHPVAPAIPAVEGNDVEQSAPVVAGSTTTIPDNQPLDVPPRLENLGYALFLMLAVIAIGKPIIRIIGGIIERRGLRPALPADFGGRLERIEQGIEAVSIEIERISESQRYLLKVQSPTPDRVEIPRSAG